MKKVIMMFFCLGLLIFCMQNAEAGPIKLKVYGKGGIIQKPDGIIYVCPHVSTDVCTEVTIEGFLEPEGSLKGLNGSFCYKGKQMKVIIQQVNILFIDGDQYTVNGLVVRERI